MRIRNSCLVAGLAAVAILAAGCGSTDKSGGGNTATPTSKSAVDVAGCGKSPGKAASGAPIQKLLLATTIKGWAAYGQRGFIQSFFGRQRRAGHILALPPLVASGLRA